MTPYIRFTIGGMLLVALCATGCRKPVAGNANPAGGQTQPGVAQPNPAGNPLQVGVGQAPAQGDIRRGAERQIDQNLLTQIGKYYIQFNLENNRSPSSVEELLATMKDAPGNFRQALQDGWIVLVPNAPTTSNTVILYEKNVYQKNNNRLAAFGDGHVVLMPEPEFQAALKSGGQ
jgi:hypothetical protein